MDCLDHAGLVRSWTFVDTLRPITTAFSFVEPNVESFPMRQSSSGTSRHGPASIGGQTGVHFVSRYTPVGTVILSVAFVILTLRGFETAPPIRHVSPPAPASCPVGFQRWWPQGREFDDRATQCIKARTAKAGLSKDKKAIDSVSQSSRNSVTKTRSWK